MKATGEDTETALAAEDIIDADYKVAKLMPLVGTPLNKTFPVLCCLCGGESKKDEDMLAVE